MSAGEFAGSREAHTFAECAWHDCPTHNAGQDPAYTPAKQWAASTAPVLCTECLLAHMEEVSLKANGSCACCANGHFGKGGR